MAFVRATKSQAKGRLALFGVSGAGKTWTALSFAKVLGARIAVIDTENGSAAKYADAYSFDHCVLSEFSPENYIKAIHEAEEAGYDVLIIDSISHAWTGKGGVLEIVDNVTARSKSGNAFSSGWREATPQHNALVDAMVQCKCHLIVCCRQKSDWVMEELPNGKKMPRKIGMAPVQREGLEFEFDVAGDIDLEHTLVITKSRCRDLADKVFKRPGDEVAKIFREWLSDGSEVGTASPHNAPSTPTPPTQTLATELQIGIAETLAKGIDSGVIKKWFAKAGVKSWAEMPSDAIDKCIAYMQEHARAPESPQAQTQQTPAAHSEPSPASDPAPSTKTTKQNNTSTPPAVQEQPPTAWDAFLDECLELAGERGANCIIEIEKRVAAIGKKGKEDTISQATRDRWRDAIKNGKFLTSKAV